MADRQPIIAEDAAALKRILDTYWPVIVHARHLRNHYAGVIDGDAKIAPDAAGALIEALNTAEASCMVRQTEDPS